MRFEGQHNGAGSLRRQDGCTRHPLPAAQPNSSSAAAAASYLAFQKKVWFQWPPPLLRTTVAISAGSFSVPTLLLRSTMPRPLNSGNLSSAAFRLFTYVCVRTRHGTRTTVSDPRLGIGVAEGWGVRLCRAVPLLAHLMVLGVVNVHRGGVHIRLRRTRGGNAHPRGT